MGAAVEQSIRLRRLLRRGQWVMVAVSGGVDSMALLGVLHELAARHEWRIVVAHFNHRLRGAESDGDERFVKETAANLKLKFVSARAEVGAVARGHKISVEMAARKLRHDFFVRAARRFGIATVALAHHADDQVESFFLRLLRGAGSEGLAGMKWTSPSPNDPAIRLVRPFLDQPKSALLSFAEEQGIAFREDATNGQLDFLRNRIRHKLLPLLSQKYQPALVRSILRTMDIVGEDADFVRCAAEAWLGKKRRVNFEGLHSAVQRQAMQIQLMKMGVAPEFNRVEQLRGSADQDVTVGAALNVYRDATGRIVQRMIVRPQFDPDRLAVNLERRKGTVEFGGLHISWEVRRGAVWSRRKAKLASGCECFDADKVGCSIVLRHWQPGDRYQPIGMELAAKLQNIFSNQKISRAQRHQLVVATTATSELFWVQGLRMGERFKLDNGTVRLLEWKWRNRESMVASGDGPC